MTEREPRSQRFLFYARDGRQQVDVRKILGAYGVTVLDELGDDIVVACVTPDTLERLRSDNPAIAFEVDAKYELLGATSIVAARRHIHRP